MQFEKNLVLLRKKKGLSQDELAFAIGVSRQTIYTWEAGLNYPNIVMVKKIADVLEVTTDDLLNGFEVNRLPKTLKDVNLTYVSKHNEEVLYKELPNWFVSLRPESEVSWGIYDLVKGELIKDYSYHVETLYKTIIHNVEGMEIEVKEYDPSLNMDRKYNLFVSLNDEGVLWLGEINIENEVKTIRTFKDKEFLKDWGYNKKNVRQNIQYQNAENYVLEINGKKQNVIKISYFEDNRNIYFEVFLNLKFESLLSRRYTNESLKREFTNEKVTINNETYDLDYYCLTSRLF